MNLILSFLTGFLIVLDLVALRKIKKKNEELTKENDKFKKIQNKKEV